MNRTINNFARWVMLGAGLAIAPWAEAQRSGQSGSVTVGRAGPAAPYSPPKMSMPKAFVPGAPMSAVGRQVRVPTYAIPPRTGSGLTRPLPVNFGGVRVELPGPIGGKTPPSSTTFYPYNRRSPGRHVGPSRFGGAAVSGSDSSVGVHIGTGDAHPGGWPRGDRPSPDPGFYGYIGTGGATLGYRATGDGFSFRAHLGEPWLDRGRSCLGKQWGTCSPCSWNWGWGWPRNYNYSYGYGYPIYSPIWPYPDPLLSSYYYPPATAAQPDPADAAAPALTVLEQAELLLGYERFDEAAAAFREQLSQQPDDAETLRMLAVTLLLDRRPREAGEAMLAAYRMNPSLADSPVVLPAGLGPSDLAAAANRAIEHAQRTRSAPSWLSAAVLSQARDKLPVARNFAKSAKAAGLDPEVYARLMSSWST